jgi:hypothetical protein
MAASTGEHSMDNKDLARVIASRLFEMPMKVNNQPSNNIGLFLGLVMVAYLTHLDGDHYQMINPRTNERYDFIGSLSACRAEAARLMTVHV